MQSDSHGTQVLICSFLLVLSLDLLLLSLPINVVGRRGNVGVIVVRLVASAYPGMFLLRTIGNYTGPGTVSRFTMNI